MDDGVVSPLWEVECHYYIVFAKSTLLLDELDWGYCLDGTFPHSFKTTICCSQVAQNYKYQEEPLVEKLFHRV